ncbi:hypothetical protein Q1695_000713 [Nippostrongylus brasiliensis]|nr:hypothetical protein Q1695_000713 [Nippostrongylus brasiliensis]
MDVMLSQGSSYLHVYEFFELVSVAGFLTYHLSTNSDAMPDERVASSHRSSDESDEESPRRSSEETLNCLLGRNHNRTIHHLVNCPKQDARETTVPEQSDSAVGAPSSGCRNRGRKRPATLDSFYLHAPERERRYFSPRDPKIERPVARVAPMVRDGQAGHGSLELPWTQGPIEAHQMLDGAVVARMWERFRFTERQLQLSILQDLVEERLRNEPPTPERLRPFEALRRLANAFTPARRNLFHFPRAHPGNFPLFNANRVNETPPAETPRNEAAEAAEAAAENDDVPRLVDDSDEDSDW